MKYYNMCNKILEQKEFEALINELTKDIAKRFSDQILLDKYIEILEINIKEILIISISNFLELNNTEKEEKINLKIGQSNKYILLNTVKEMEQRYKRYIDKIEQNLKNSN